MLTEFAPKVIVCCPHTSIVKICDATVLLSDSCITQCAQRHNLLGPRDLCSRHSCSMHRDVRILLRCSRNPSLLARKCLSSLLPLLHRLRAREVKIVSQHRVTLFQLLPWWTRACGEKYVSKSALVSCEDGFQEKRLGM